ncbi:Predicted unusual protein kinase regulating ubiquinone biosynthesis, AarF/ABC1/UbiB family [Geodermatophilus ruber]|uniref:Predicted unusual protein kinase regulating ubiquinone biosynthesis, AarF/ABC1/UbiB family n=2 Tax=Geodermatophilus ruber TaxID=504800 RepID=A0A1I4C3C7_9ACTN|nr:Predicted unusual protein kinase regulating ubiquinone biosynthesis, AarF/ABC1/UbiB family [Geodermatophilus ruber]
MGSHLDVGHAARYATLGRLLLKHRGAPLTGPGQTSDLDLDGYAPDGSEVTEADAVQLVEELVRMGPTFIKLGQLLSTRADLLPPVYLEALSRLRDDVEPMERGVAEKVIEEELGVRITHAFGSFEPDPIGSASLGQVHRATLRDGRPVAVKVQRPGIRRRALEDMEVIAELAEFVDNHSERASRLGFGSMVEQFRASLVGELDYRREAANLEVLGDALAEYDRIVVPRPVDDYTTSRVLTMDYVDGRSVDSLTPLGRTELDSEDLADQLLGAYLHQVLVHGFFHADPHPGNVLLTRDGRLALIDLGMVARLSPEIQDQLSRLLLAISSGDSSAAADALERLGDRLDDYDPEALRTRVADLLLRYGRATVGELSAGRSLVELAMAASSCGLRPGAELTMLAKSLLNLDEVARTLDPGVRIDEIIESHAAAVMRHRMAEKVRPAKVMRSALDAAAFAEQLPNRLNKVLESLAEGRVNLRLEGLDEGSVIRGAQKLANRVTAGVMIAAFVISAALFSSAPHASTLWGYPLLTIVFLGLAILTAVWVAVGMLRRDLPERRSGRR